MPDAPLNLREGEEKRGRDSIHLEWDEPEMTGGADTLFYSLYKYESNRDGPVLLEDDITSTNV